MSPLIRLYPRSWRDRYGDELAALLEDRPPGPSDALDLILGAFDAHLHRRHAATATKSTLSVRIGSRAAVAGGALWIVALAFAIIGWMSDSDLAMVLIAVAMLALLVALAALSAVQSRSHPVLVWASFLLPAVGIVLLAVGATAQLAVGDRPLLGDLTPWYLWFIGIVLALVGCAIFGIVSAATGGLVRRSAGLLCAGAVFQLGTLVGHDVATDGALMLGGAFAFGLGWIMVGVGASRARAEQVAEQAG